MAQASSPADDFSALLEQRLVRYADLRPCTTAFIDTRTPGSAEKENFTIIGPGVAESPDQHVHVDIAHGFNVGGARQPPGCVNSQHSHETAEVFMVHAGRWAFLLGPNKEDGEVVLGPGDTISIPVHVFRGFKNVGDDVGFMFAVLGGDDPGHVTWAPYVFENAKEYGLVLMEDGSLVDTTKGETVPDSRQPMRPTTDADLRHFSRLTAAELAGCVVSGKQLTPSPTPALAGMNESPIIGAESAAEGLAAGRMAWPHGFQLRHVSVDPASGTATHIRHEEEVIIVHEGELTVELPGGRTTIRAGDVLTVPVEMPRRYQNESDDAVMAWVVRGGDAPSAPTIVN